MRILHIAPSIDPKSGGPTRSITGLCRALAQSGEDVTLFVHSPAHDLLNPSGVQFMKGHGAGIRTAIEDTRDVLQRVKPDVVHLHGLWLPLNHFDLQLSKANGVPVVLSPRGMLDPWALAQKRIKKKIAWWLYQYRDLQRITAFHATAEMEKQNILGRGFTQPIFMVPNAVEVPSNPMERSMETKTMHTALFLSRLHPGKGLLELAEAWAALKNDQAWRAMGTWRMRVVGPDGYGHKAEVIERLKQLGIEADWTFVGEVDDCNKWTEYCAADLFVHPSHSENFGISIAEALSAGLPVITTKGTPWSELENCASARMSECANQRADFSEQKLTNALMNSRTNEFARTGRAGWWIDVGVKPLVEALKEALSLSDHERLSMGRNGQRLIEGKYTWSSVAKNMLEAYRRILNHEN